MSKKYRVDTDKGSFIVETEDPAAPGAAAPDNRTTGQVALDQAKNVGTGFLHGLAGIPSTIAEVGGITKDMLTGNSASAQDRLKNDLSGAYHGIVDPIATSVRGAGALAESHGMLPPGTVQAPSRGDWETAAQDAGAQLGNGVAGEALAKVPTSAEGLQNVANKLRAIKAGTGAGVGGAAGAGIGAAAGGPVGAAVGAGVGGTIGAKAVPAVANGAASLIERLARARAAVDSAPTVADTPSTPVRTVQPSPEVQQVQPNVNTNVDFRQPGAPSGPLPQTPELGQLQQQMAQSGAPDMPTRPPSASSGPLPATPELQQLQKQMAQSDTPSMETRQPSQSTGNAGTSPELQQLQQQMVAHPNAGEITPRNIQMAREAILQNGASRSTANLLKVSRNVPELLKTAPELQGVPPGPNFDAKLYSAFNRIGHELNATEASIPDTTQVPTTDAVTQLKALESKYVDTNQPQAVRAIDKVRSFLEERPSMQWSDFIDAKRSFFNEINLSSAAGREAYQVFKKLSNDVSPDLGKLNQQYYTVKSAMENAAMDTRTGEKIRTIGKSQKPVGTAPPTEKTLRMPL